MGSYSIPHSCRNVSIRLRFCAVVTPSLSHGGRKLDTTDQRLAFACQAGACAHSITSGSHQGGDLDPGISRGDSGEAELRNDPSRYGLSKLRGF